MGPQQRGQRAAVLVGMGAGLCALSLLLPLASFPIGNPGHPVYLMDQLPLVGLGILIAQAGQWVLTRRPGRSAGRIGALLAALVLLVLAGLLGLLEFGTGSILCWDGTDTNGRPIGGCDNSLPSLGSFFLTAGVLLSVAGAELRLSADRPGRVKLSPEGPAPATLTHDPQWR